MNNAEPARVRRSAAWRRRVSCPRAGTTLVELLVVITVAAIVLLAEAGITAVPSPLAYSFQTRHSY